MGAPKPRVRGRIGVDTLEAEIAIGIEPTLFTKDGYTIAENVRQTLLDNLNHLNNPYWLSNILVIVEPS